jgi:CheY-like chemotaxis protein
MIEDLLKLLQETFPRTISYDLDLDPAVGSITGDQNQLHQALLNLCVNARDAMPDGGELIFSTSVVDGPTLREQFPDADQVPYARLSIRDTGAGIAQLNRGHIFEPFFTTKERGRGTGLGLAVVYGIVKSHNGLIDFTSEVNKGTTFNMYFPMSSGIKKSSPIHTEAVEVVQGGTETVLIVEDEEMLLGLLKDLFESKGYRVLTATDGVEAVELFTSRKDEIALVLSDMGLPRMSGLEAFQAMKVQKPNVKMILASGYLEPKLRNQLIAEGAQDFVQKPYEPTEILKKVREILSQK